MRALKFYKLGTFCFGLLLFLLGCINNKTDIQPQKRVYVAETESGYQLIKDGQPFYVKGACVGDDHWAEFKAAGGNTIRIYDPANLKEKLDRADSLGLMVAVDILLPHYREDYNWYAIPENVAQVTRQITELVSANKDHPALLFWILGNEVGYPISMEGNQFISHFNTWIGLIHQLDPDHPVTSTITGMSRKSAVSMSLRSPDLDFLAFNFFGMANSFNKRINHLSAFWKGPFMTTEWGINGPWESRETTSWGAPIEQTSTKKAEVYGERYRLIRKLSPSRFLGSFVFFWGQKEERTPTWFSAFLRDGRPTQVVHEAAGFWREDSTSYTGPKLGYILLEGKGAPSSIILPPGKEVIASIHKTSPDPSGLLVQWEIRQENWFRANNYDNWKRIPEYPDKFKILDSKKMQFTTPEEEGPYRLYLFLGDPRGRVATANVPFYILNTEDAE